jgi:hypothetical protein
MKNEKNLILGFDSWTGGIRNYIRLVDPLNNLGYHLILLHIGSWGHDKGREQEEFIEGLHVRDIAYYKGSTFYEILKIEKPKAVIFLSLSAFAHMSFNRTALFLNIPTINLFHGLVNVQDFSAPVEGKSLSVYNFNFLKSKLAKDLSKNIFRLIPNYINSLIITKAPFQQWVKLFEHINDKLLNKLHINFDCKTTKTFVYVESDVSFANKVIGNPIDSIEVVGNPDLMDFKIEEMHIGLSLKNLDPPKKITYIDTATIEWGHGHSSFDEYFEHYVETCKTVKSLGYEFAVKFHPAILRKYSLSPFEEMGIEIISNDNFLTNLLMSKAVIVESSSVAVVPGILGLPIFLAKYGNLKKMTFGEAINSYERVSDLNDLKNLGFLLENVENNFSKENTLKWINQTVGPLPSSQMPSRVASSINRLINN